MLKGQEIEDLKQQISVACAKLYGKNFVANHDGNITFRLDDGRILATPTAFSKGDVKVSDILILDDKGTVIAGPHKVFSEVAWHLAVYRVRPDVKCVVHGHPPAASAYGLARRDLGTPALPEAIVSLGRHILTAKFFSPLDPELKKIDGEVDRELRRVLNESDAFVATGNGVWAVGQDVMQTYYRFELVEQIALQHMYAEKLGSVVGLPSLLVDELMKRRPQAGSKPSPEPSATVPCPIEKQSQPGPDPDHIREVVRHELEKIFSK